MFDMLAGRLELFPLLILFHPSIWKELFIQADKKAEIACRTDQRKTRSDIVKCSCDSREIGSEIIVFNGNKQH